MSTKQQTADAFAKGRSAQCHNARTDGETYRLHGHAIAWKENGVVKFNWCGYYTKTTAAHMNAILKSIGAAFRVSYAKARDRGVQTFEWGV